MRYLCLIAALLSPRPAPLLVLNEPETSLHPDLFAPLGELILDAATRSQLIVTTHAEPLVARLSKAREVLNRFKGSNAGGLDVDKIEQALSHAPATSPAPNEPLPTEARQQLLQLALVIADQTL